MCFLCAHSFSFTFDIFAPTKAIMNRVLTIARLLVLTLTGMAQNKVKDMKTVYDFSLKDKKGNDVSLSLYKGKALKRIAAKIPDCMMEIIRRTQQKSKALVYQCPLPLTS